ncbi:hypothetical protein BD779DRAFT_1785029 [Infundibulicybe gibba]|nr:hypothetical protein BD779DRAFT_1785029 [Infundibulicybe gibba]
MPPKSRTAWAPAVNPPLPQPGPPAASDPFQEQHATLAIETTAQTPGAPAEATGEVFSAFMSKSGTDLPFIAIPPAFDALADKTKWKHGNFSFAFKTATGNMRNHLERLHSKEVIAISLEKGWPILLSGYKTVQALKNAGGVPFSYKAVLDRLIKFICVNDQASTILIQPVISQRDATGCRTIWGNSCFFNVALWTTGPSAWGFEFLSVNPCGGLQNDML